MSPVNYLVAERPLDGPAKYGKRVLHYLDRVPGMMFRLGAAGDSGPWPGLHTPTFGVDEACLAVGENLRGRSSVVKPIIL